MSHIFVSERVARFILETKLTGVKAVRVEDMSIPEIRSDFGAGKLRYHLPEPRAREIGEPLGIY
jgi:hypothetical protein